MWLVSIPHAHLAPRPFWTMRSGVAESVRIQLSTPRNMRRQVMGDGSVRGFHAVQMSCDVGSDDKAGELSGKKIERDQRNHYQQKNRNHANKNIGDNQPVSQP